jgi:CRISPR-associated endonuclease Cas3-HD
MMYDDLMRKIQEKLEGVPAYLEVKNGEVYDEKLIDHLMDTSEKMASIFSDRLTVIEHRTRESYRWNNGELIEFAKAVGLLHDIGKASKHYHKEFIKKKSESLTFYNHELISAFLILKSIEDEEDSSIRKRGKLMARIVARHHSAMENRHPLRAKCNREVVKSAMNLMNESFINQVLKKCEEYELCSALSKKGFPKLQENEDLCRDRMGDLKIVTDANALEERADDFILVNSLTGMLMVADNLVAIEKRRSGSTTDLSTPLYIRHWQMELGEITNSREI